MLFTQKGANLYAKNKLNETPLDCTKEKHSNVFNCLRMVDQCISQRDRRSVILDQFHDHRQHMQHYNENFLFGQALPGIGGGTHAHQNNLGTLHTEGASTAVLVDLLMRKFTGKKHNKLGGFLAEIGLNKEQDMNTSEMHLQKAIAMMSKMDI